MSLYKIRDYTYVYYWSSYALPFRTVFSKSPSLQSRFDNTKIGDQVYMNSTTGYSTDGEHKADTDIKKTYL